MSHLQEFVFSYFREAHLCLRQLFFDLLYLGKDRYRTEEGRELGIDMNKQDVTVGVRTARHVDTKEDRRFKRTAIISLPLLYKKVIQKYLNVTFKDGVCQPLKKSALA